MWHKWFDVQRIHLGCLPTVYDGLKTSCNREWIIWATPTAALVPWLIKNALPKVRGKSNLKTLLEVQQDQS